MALIGLASAWAAACRGPAPVPADSVTRDSLGVPVVENYAPAWGAQQPWLVDSVPLVTIPAESPFTVRLRMATRLSDGRLALLSAALNQIGIFDTTGVLVRAIGRQGEGPGEFRTAERMQRLPGDTLLVWDTSFGPRTAFDTAGRVLSIQQIDLERFTEAIGRDHWSEELTPLSGGAFIAHLNRHGSDQGEDGALYRAPRGYTIVTPDYVAHPLGWYGGWGSVTFTLGGQRVTATSPFTVRSSVATAERPDRIFITDGEPRDVLVFDRDGRMLRIIRRTDPPVPFPEHAAEITRQAFLSGAKTDDERKARGAFLRSLPTPASTIMALQVDSDGYLWTRGSAEGWNVFDPQGVWLGRVRVPVHEILEIGRDYLIGSRRDSLGVVHVAEYSLRRTTPKAPGDTTPR